jgi:hypothetical protein
MWYVQHARLWKFIVDLIYSLETAFVGPPVPRPNLRAELRQYRLVVISQLDKLIA